ncbi:MAG TPA: hypothetical protein VM287_14180 [Egibacteraceae bacterium]|nr:hypothetical protein [Egibacteraceae bacterium]
MHRRALLKSAGVAAGTLVTGGVLAACGDSGGEEGQPAGESSVETSTGQEQTLTVISASYETLAGNDRRFAFGVATAENVPLRDADLDVRVRDLDGNELAGPFPAEFADVGGPLGVYLTRIDVPDPGRVLVSVADGDDVGEVAVNVVAAEDSELPVPGDPAIATATPTDDDPMGFSELCTREPACGMHDVSLDDALAAGRPIMLMFATPAFCQTAVCGPAVDNLEEVRADGEWDDVAFIHVEIFSDEGQTLAEPVAEWDLPTEPWLFTIAADGTIVDRLDAIMVPDELRDMATALT